MLITRWRGSYEAELAPEPRAGVRSSRWSISGLVACLAGAIVLAAWTPGARADDYSLSVESEFELAPFETFFDVGRLVLAVAAPETARFSCNSGWTQTGNAIVMIAVAQTGRPQSSDFCNGYTQAYVGPLAPGQYQVTAHVIRDDGPVLADLSQAITVVARGAKCNANPFDHRIDATPQTGTLEQFVVAFQTNPVYRSQFRDVTLLGIDDALDTLVFDFPTLADPLRVVAQLRQTGEFDMIATGGAICFSAPPPSYIGTVVEYYNSILDHYFMTPDANEQAAIDAGKVGPGWSRTGEGFRAVLLPGCPEAIEGGFHPVYRFAGIPNVGPNSHFFTVTQDECAVVRDKVEWHWYFEGAPFWATEPSQGTCPPGTQVLLRAYNNGKGGSPNHRYSTNPAIIEAMVAQGWVSEGTAMCVVP